jgi:hypothetical protein
MLRLLNDFFRIHHLALHRVQACRLEGQPWEPCGCPDDHSRLLLAPQACLQTATKGIFLPGDISRPRITCRLDLRW